MLRLQRLISWRQFRRWQQFDAIHPIDARDRNDTITARGAALVANALGAKDVRESDLDIARFKPREPDESTPTNRQQPARKRARAKASSPGLDPAILMALGDSDGRNGR